MLGDAAGQAAVQLCAGTGLDKITTDKYGASAVFKSPGGNSLNSILLTPQAITKANLQVVLDAKWIDKATLCKDVTAGAVPGC
jgi:D-xylose transport system substrate-binding protein